MGKTIKTLGQAIMIIFGIIGVISMVVLAPIIYGNSLMVLGSFVGFILLGIIIGLPLMAFGDVMMDINDIKILLMAISKNQGITNSNNDEILEDMRIFTGMVSEPLLSQENNEITPSIENTKINREELLEISYRSNLSNVYAGFSKEELQKIYVDLQIMANNKEVALGESKSSADEEQYFAYVDAQREVMDMTNGREWVCGINGEKCYAYPVYEDIDAEYVKGLIDSM